MSHWRRLSYAAGGAMAVTALGVLFYREGGEFLTVPGTLGELYLNVLFILVNKDDDWYSAPAGTYIVFNVLAYSLLFYATSWIYRGIKDSSREA